MPQLTPVSSEKRRSPINKHIMETNSSRDTRAAKRRRLSPSRLEHYPTESDGGNFTSNLLTPPERFSAPLTMALKLAIPNTEPTKEGQRTLAIRRASAHRWQPKLQRPFPSQSEIKQAYSLKLMRHYPNTLATIEPDFVKPRIETSARVDRLLKQFPLHVALELGRETRTNPERFAYQFQALSTRAKDFLEAQASNISLQINKNITASDHAQRLAWRNFSTRERNRIDRGREAMLQSGLRTDDLEKEAQGLRNKLPEWKKVHTSRFL